MRDGAWLSALLGWATREPAPPEPALPTSREAPGAVADDGREPDRLRSLAESSLRTPLALGCPVGAMHLRVDGPVAHLSLHVRPDGRTWRRHLVATPLSSDVLAGVRFVHLGRLGDPGADSPIELSVSVVPAAAGAVHRNALLGLPAGGDALVQVDQVAFDGLGVCTRSIRFDPPEAPPGEYAATLRLLWRLGGDAWVLLTVGTARVDQLFEVLPDVDRLADTIGVCGVRPDGSALGPARPPPPPS